MREMKLQDLKSKTPAELVSFAEENGVENASTMRKQELMFAILKQLAIQEIDIIGEGVVEVLSDGFGFLRSPDASKGYRHRRANRQGAARADRRAAAHRQDGADAEHRALHHRQPSPPKTSPSPWQI